VLSDQHTTRTKSPKDCSEAELEAFENFVKAGDEVEREGLHSRIIKASHLLFLYDSTGMLAGVSAIKRPYPDYRNKVFAKAGVAALAKLYEVELGWVFVAPTHRDQRLSRKLVEQIMPYADGNLIYATTRRENEPMLRTLCRYGFHHEGKPYKSKRGDYELVLFVQNPL